MKTAISIPDKIFRRAERLAKARKLSRSELYTRALVQLMDAEPKQGLTQAYDAAFADDKDDRDDAFARKLGIGTLREIEW